MNRFSGVFSTFSRLTIHSLGSRNHVLNKPVNLIKCQCSLLYSSGSVGKLVVGDQASLKKVFNSKDVEQFSSITGDTNPIHLDPEFAKTTRFKKPVVHGVLTLGLISCLLGTKLPGNGSVIISYNVEHPAPLFVNEAVIAQVKVAELQGRKVTFDILCFTDDEKVVAKGTCLMLVPKHLIQ